MISWRKIKQDILRSGTPSAARKSGKDKRLAIRRKQRLSQGFIWSERMAFSKTCSIRDISATGACIDLDNSAVKHQTMKGIMSFYSPADKQEIDCEVVWRTGGSVGLRFIGAYREPTRAYGRR
jgi:hypothetical protein